MIEWIKLYLRKRHHDIRFSMCYKRKGQGKFWKKKEKLKWVKSASKMFWEDDDYKIKR